MIEVDDEVVLARVPPTLWRRIDGALVVLGPHATAPRVIVGPAASVWDRLDGWRTFGAVVVDLADANNAPVAQVRADLQRVIGVLEADGAVERTA